MIKFILPAKEIPDDSVVIKVTGSTEYILTRQLKIYSADREKQTVEGKGIVYLLNKDNPSSINAYAEDTEFKVLVAEEDSEEFLRNVLASRRFY